MPALANLTLLLNTLRFPFGNLNFVSPPHRRASTSLSKPCPNKTFPHQQDFFPIKSVTKSSTARFSHENLVEKFKIFVQDFVPIRTALKSYKMGKPIKIKTEHASRCYCIVRVILNCAGLYLKLSLPPTPVPFYNFTSLTPRA